MYDGQACGGMNLRKLRRIPQHLGRYTFDGCGTGRAGPHCGAMSRNYLIPEGTGKRVRQRRTELELTQGKLGEMVSRHVKARTGRDKSYSDGWVRAIEHEKGSALIDAAIGLADALGVSMDWLYGRTVGPDIIIEPDGSRAMIEVKQRLDDLDDALEPVDSLLDGAAAPIPLDEARRGRKRADARPPRT